MPRKNASGVTSHSSSRYKNINKDQEKSPVPLHRGKYE